MTSYVDGCALSSVHESYGIDGINAKIEYNSCGADALIATTNGCNFIAVPVGTKRCTTLANVQAHLGATGANNKQEPNAETEADCGEINPTRTYFPHGSGAGSVRGCDLAMMLTVCGEIFDNKDEAHHDTTIVKIAAHHALHKIYDRSLQAQTNKWQNTSKGRWVEKGSMQFGPRTLHF